MGTSTQLEKINKAKKKHSCSWCGESIGLLESYYRYRWFDGLDASTVKLHEECRSAMEDEVQQNGCEIEFQPGDNNRGCNCWKCPECKHCNG